MGSIGGRTNRPQACVLTFLGAHARRKACQKSLANNTLASLARMQPTVAPPPVGDASELFILLTPKTSYRPWEVPCCHTAGRVLQLPPASERGGCSTECELACSAEANCTYFSFNPRLRRCWLCEELSNVTNLMHVRTCVSRPFTWMRRPAEPLPQNRAFKPSCGRYGLAAPRQGRKQKTRPPKNELAQSLSQGMAKFLGMPTDAPFNGPTPSSSCADWGEERAFRETCSEQIQTLDGHLAATRGRRAVFFEIGGLSEWGWGNLMPVVFALHWVCLHASRYCYIKLQDQQMGSVLGYANGDVWGADSENDVYKLFGSSQNATKINHGFAWTLWRNSTRLEMLAQQLRDHEAPLIFAYFPSAYPIQANALLPFLKGPERLPISSRAGADGPWWSGARRMDRCFCRYVTQPRIQEVVAKLPSRLRALLSQYEAAPARVAVHLRTM